MSICDFGAHFCTKDDCSWNLGVVINVFKLSKKAWTCVL